MRVSSVHARALVEAFESYGQPSSQLFSAAGVEPAAIAEGYSWLDVAQLDALTCAAVSLTEDEAFGLSWGERSSMIQFDLASLMLGSAPSLRTGLEALLRFQEILGERPELLFSETEDGACFRFEPFAISEQATRVRAELAVRGFWRLLELADPQVSAQMSAYFAYSRPSYGAEYDWRFSARARFDHGFTGLEFPRATLDRPLPRNPSLFEVLDKQASQVRSRVLSESSLRERIKQQLLRTLPEVPEMPAAASAMGMSERSLRRRLEDEGSSYSQLVEEAKLDLARELLAARERPIKQVALELGFADVSSFHRAFKRWTGQTPAEFRAQPR
jgi:AraC-like DNA-binding protein